MAFFIWDNSYSVGVSELDNQHKGLVNILNELFEAMQENRSKEVLGGIISRLVTYTKTHFSTEERYMQTYSYPELAAQKREHALLTDQVIKFKNDFDSGKVALTVQLTSFLKNWLVQHIQGSDKKYGPFLNAKGVH